MLQQSGETEYDTIKLIRRVVRSMVEHESFPVEPGVEVRPEIVENCGVFGVYDTSGERDLRELALRAAAVQQHRGQEAAGLSVGSVQGVETYAAPGLVSSLSPREVALLDDRAVAAISHVRYGTIPTGAEPGQFVQPIQRNGFSIAHNGHWEAAALNEAGVEFVDATSDTERVASLIEEHHKPGADISDTLREVLPKVREGAFSLVVTTEDKLIAVRDPYGFRPLVMGSRRNADGTRSYAFASETIALDVNDFSYERDVEPGEMIEVNNRGIFPSFPFGYSSDTERRRLCSLEYGYFSDPSSRIDGEEVLFFRKQLGRALAAQDREEGLVDFADLVIGVPESGLPAAEGYAAESGIPYETGIKRRSYEGRTFISPVEADRASRVSMKLWPYRSVVRGMRLVVVDDSIVRGTTARELVQMLFRAGAAEVHLRSSLPAYIDSCYMGIDTGDQAELLAHRMAGDVEAMREEVGATSLRFLEIPRMEYVLSEGARRSAEKLGRRATGLCTSCFTGEYPIRIRRREER